MSSTEGSVTRWIDELRRGDEESARKLWERYFTQLVRMTRARMRQAPRGIADEEDIALTAFENFCRGVERGQFPQLKNRFDLWNLLLAIAEHKMLDQLRYEQQQKRGGRKQQRPSAITEAQPRFDQLVSREPAPEMAVMLGDELERMLTLLESKDLQAVAIHKLEGLTDNEVAERLGCTRRTVVRKLRVIRGVWMQEQML